MSSSPASRSVPTRRVVVSSVLATGFVVAAAAIAFQPIGAAAVGPSASSAGPSASNLRIVTTQPLLRASPVPGANQSTTTAGRTPGPDRSNKTTRSTNYKVWGIVAALVVIAVIVGVLTWLYWRRTRPEQNPVSPQDRWHPQFRDPAGAATQAPGAPATPVESAPPSGEAGASRKVGPDTRDHTTAVPVAGDHGDREEKEPAAGEPAAAEPAAAEPAAAEPEPRDERASGEEASNERGSSHEFADERGPDGVVGRIRRRSRYADIVITVPHPEDLRREPS